MNCESWLEEKNSLMEEVSGRILTSDCGVIDSKSLMDILCWTVLVILARPLRNCSCKSSPTQRMRLLPR